MMTTCTVYRERSMHALMPQELTIPTVFTLWGHIAGLNSADHGGVILHSVLGFYFVASLQAKSWC